MQERKTRREKGLEPESEREGLVPDFDFRFGGG